MRPFGSVQEPGAVPFLARLFVEIRVWKKGKAKDSGRSEEASRRLSFREAAAARQEKFDAGHGWPVFNLSVQKTVAKFRSFAEAERADRDFYRRLSGNERLAILLELLRQNDQLRFERVHRVTQLAPR